MIPDIDPLNGKPKWMQENFSSPHIQGFFYPVDKDYLQGIFAESDKESKDRMELIEAGNWLEVVRRTTDDFKVFLNLMCNHGNHVHGITKAPEWTPEKLCFIESEKKLFNEMVQAAVTLSNNLKRAKEAKNFHNAMAKTLDLFLQQTTNTFLNHWIKCAEVVMLHARINGVDPNNRNYYLDLERKDAVFRNSHKWGTSRAEIGRNYGFSRQAVHKRLMKLFPDRDPSDRLTEEESLAISVDLKTNPKKR